MRRIFSPFPSWEVGPCRGRSTGLAHTCARSPAAPRSPDAIRVHPDPPPHRLGLPRLQPRSESPSRLEVPRTFNELWRTLRGFPGFAVSFALLFVIWHAQYQWFRRYGLHDGPSLALNAILLFLVLLFTYPLKFVFSLTIGGLLGQPMGIPLADGTVIPPIRAEQLAPMMTTYGLGYVAVFAIFALLHLHLHALRRADVLGLDALEHFDTRFALREAVINCCIRVASIALVLATGSGFWSGMTYVLIGPSLALHGTPTGPRRRPLEAAALATFAG